MRILIALSLCLALFLLPLIASAEGPSADLFKKDAPIDLTADSISYDKTKDLYHATGKAVIKQDGVTVMADEVMIDMTVGAATATGNVVVTDEGGNTLRSEDLRMNINEKTVVVANGRIFYKLENVHLAGSVIRKTGKETYNADSFSYTTCDCPDDEAAPWSFTASSTELTVGEYMTGWNAFFRIKDVPVLYTPYVSIPIKRERQSGFLQPKPGYSKLRGFIFKDSFFWAISKNTDATFDLDMETARGLGKGVEFRYIRNRRSFGEATFFHFKEKDIDRVREFRSGTDNLERPMNATDDRWRFKWQHNETMPAGVLLKVRMDLISDDEYFIDFGRGTDERSLESVESNVSLNKNWSVYSLTAQARLFNNLLVDSDSTTLQMLPIVGFTSLNQRLGPTPLYISSESTFVNFSRQEGLRGQRIDIQPRISLPLRPGGNFDFTTSVGPRATYYLVKDDPNGRFTDRYIYDATASLTTTLSRVYFPDYLTLPAVRHTIRPKIAYTYIPGLVQTDNPQFDSVDNIAQSNTVTYSLNTVLTGKFLGKEKPDYRNIVYLDLSHSYDLNEATRQLQSDTDRHRPFGSVNAEIKLLPANSVKLTANGAYDIYKHWFASYDTSVSLSDARGDSIELSRRFIRAESDYFEASTILRANDRWSFTYNKRFSFVESRSLETSFGVEYKHQCWGYLLTYTVRPEERVAYLTFNLLGLGKVAGLQGRIEPM